MRWINMKFFDKIGKKAKQIGKEIKHDSSKIKKFIEENQERSYSNKIKRLNRQHELTIAENKLLKQKEVNLKLKSKINKSKKLKFDEKPKKLKIGLDID